MDRCLSKEGQRSVAGLAPFSFMAIWVDLGTLKLTLTHQKVEHLLQRVASTQVSILRTEYGCGSKLRARVTQVLVLASIDQGANVRIYF